MKYFTTPFSSTSFRAKQCRRKPRGTGIGTKALWQGRVWSMRKWVETNVPAIGNSNIRPIVNIKPDKESNVIRVKPQQRSSDRMERLKKYIITI